MDELPHKLKLEFAMIVHEQLYQDIKFFKTKEGKSKPANFIAWITMLMKPMLIEDEKYIYQEGEEALESKRSIHSYF